MKELSKKLKTLYKGEDGQSLVFGVMTIFLVLFFAAMVMGVGRVAARRIQMQFAADAAAYSAATAESECLNAISLINKAMAQVRARSLRYVSDTYAYGSLNELREKATELQTLADQLSEQIEDLEQQRDAETNPDARAALEEQIDMLQKELSLIEETTGGEAPPSGPGTDPDWVREIVGIDRADLEYQDALQTSEDWLPAAGRWTRELSRLEHTIAILAPYLSSETAYAVAQKNGAEYVSVFPCSRWLPRDDAYLNVEVFHPNDECWRVQGGDTQLEVCTEDPQAWEITWRRGASIEGRYRVERQGEHKWYLYDYIRDSSVWIDQTTEINVVTWGPEGIEVIQHDGFMELINENGTPPNNRLFVRRIEGDDVGGGLRWDEEEQAWVEGGPATGGVIEMVPGEEVPAGELPDDDDFSPLPSPDVSVDGVAVTVNVDPVIPLPGSAMVHLRHPPFISLTDRGNREWGRVYLYETTYFTANINGVHAEVRSGKVDLRNRGENFNTNHATGRWRTHFDRVEEYWWQHRFTEVTDDYYWLYEYMEFGARLQPETNYTRLMGHRDVDDSAMPNSEVAEADYMPFWCYDSDSQPEGWIGANNGLLLPASNDDEYAYEGYWVELVDEEEDIVHSKYHQVRECWNPFCLDGMLDMDGDGQADDLDNDGVPDLECGTCDGKGYVVIGGEQVNFPREDVPLNLNFLNEYRPLVLSEDFFKFGVTVGVWHRRESHFPADNTSEAPQRPLEYMLHDPSPGLRGLMEGPQQQTARERGQILKPEWGYFAVAGARTELVTPGAADGPGGLEEGCYFSNTTEREMWIEENMNNLYARDYATGWSYWRARLFPLDKQVLDEDVLLGQSGEAETGIGWLMRRIAYGSPGGRERTRQANLPVWYSYGRRHGHVSGWSKNMYGHYDQSYPPERIRQDLLEQMRGPSVQPGSGNQFDYNQLDDEQVFH